MDIHDVIKKSREAEPFTKEELVRMLSYAPTSREAFALMGEARRVSEENRGKDVHVCREFYQEAGWEVLEGPSQHFLQAPQPTPPEMAAMSAVQ